MIHCENSKCRHYWEDLCMIDTLNNELICIGSDGACESFAYGVSDMYSAESEDLGDEN